MVYLKMGIKSQEKESTIQRFKDFRLIRLILYLLKILPCVTQIRIMAEWEDTVSKKQFSFRPGTG